MKANLIQDGVDRVSFIRLTPGGMTLEQAKAALRKRGYPVDMDDDPIYIDDSAVKAVKKKRTR